jgi:2-polyprenyl-3-methyl-5-hydroxy-6-metoxy-1,4-benzoquinol methylase
VLEHVPCNATIVLQQLHALLRPGGAHVFSVPLTSGHSRSDLDPRLPRDERTARFHQRDHLRKFGRRDFDATLGMVFGLTARGYSIADHVPPETLHAAAVPEAQWTARSSTVFLVRRGKGRRGRMVPGRP